MIGWNPFQGEALRLPNEDHEWLKKLTKYGGGDSDLRKEGLDEIAPFNRMIDGWLVSIALGVCYRDETLDYAPPGDRFEYGARLAGDEHAIAFLHHVALAELLRDAGSPDKEEECAYRVIDDPGVVVSICNDLAARGIRYLRETVEAATIPVLPELIRTLAGELKAMEV